MPIAFILIFIAAILIFIGIIIALIVFLSSKKESTYEAGTESVESSYFDGKVFPYIGWRIFTSLITIITLGIAYPWASCMLVRWKVKHTVINGKHMTFDGNGAQLFGRYILWYFLCIITLGIYGIWMAVNIIKWRTKHTHFMGEKDNNSYFDGGAGGYLVYHILAGLLTIFTLSIGFPWAEKLLLSWETRHTVIDSRRLVFKGSGGRLFVKYLIWNLLTVITLGIYRLVVPIRRMQWITENTIDHEHTPQALNNSREMINKLRSEAVAMQMKSMHEEMVTVKTGITSETPFDQIALMAEAGSAAAQYELSRRLMASGEQSNTADISDWLHKSAIQGYAPALYEYAVGGYSEDDEEKMRFIEQSADQGYAEAQYEMKKLSFISGQDLDGNKNPACVGQYKKAVYLYDVLKERKLELTNTDTEEREAACRAIRKYESSYGKGHMSVSAKIGAAILCIIGVITALAVIGMVAYSLFPGIGRFILNKYGKNSYSYAVEYLDLDSVHALENTGNADEYTYTSFEGCALYKTKQDTHASNTDYVYIEGLLNNNFFDFYYDKELNIISGRMPVNTDEIIISETVSGEYGLDVNIGDIISLEVGYRIGGNGEILNQGSTIASDEKFINIATKKYTVVGIYQSSGSSYGSMIAYTMANTSDNSSRFYIFYAKSTNNSFYNNINTLGVYCYVSYTHEQKGLFGKSSASSSSKIVSGKYPSINNSVYTETDTTELYEFDDEINDDEDIQKSIGEMLAGEWFSFEKRNGMYYFGRYTFDSEGNITDACYTCEIMSDDYVRVEGDTYYYEDGNYISLCNVIEYQGVRYHINGGGFSGAGTYVISKNEKNESTYNMDVFINGNIQNEGDHSYTRTFNFENDDTIIMYDAGEAGETVYFFRGDINDYRLG